MKYINVVVDNNSRHTDSYFTYSVNSDNIKVGQLVQVPFNRGNKIMPAYVFESDVLPNYDIDKIKSIISIDQDISLNEEMVNVAIWMKTRYGIKYLDAIKSFVPTGKIPKVGKEKEPYKESKGEDCNITSLTLEQLKAVKEIAKSQETDEQKDFLIYGVTSSGKTEVYMQVIKKALDQGKTAIMLVPEIALTTQVIDRFINRFGKDTIAVLHSKLTKRERFDEWMRIRNGKAKIVIGARMAVFAPLSNIGVIILDEEHETTYKSNQTPRYETVDVALKRLMFYSGILILGSATPSVVSYQRAKEGIYQLIELKERYNKVPLPQIELVDMREELKSGNQTVFSRKLYSKIAQCLDEKKQIILFLNRRGYSNFVSCRECGTVLKCPKCGITLTYHKNENVGICHYCGSKFKIPNVCPSCKSKYLKYFGIGTEKVEEEINNLFPEAITKRFDLDTAKNRTEIAKIINDFAKAKTDVLIGTQLVAKGLDFKNVGLVGVVAADVSLNIPDYRSGERTFQLITQVSGRAGRGEEIGSVIVQTYTPSNFSLVAAANNNYEDFFNQEIKIREYMNYPPFSDLIMVSFTGNDEKLVMKTADDCKAFLEKYIPDVKNENVFSPKVALSYMESKDFKYYILIKSLKGFRNKYIYYTNVFLEKIIKENSKCNISIDVNPYSFF